MAGPVVGIHHFERYLHHPLDKGHFVGESIGDTLLSRLEVRRQGTYCIKSIGTGLFKSLGKSTFFA